MVTVAISTASLTGGTAPNAYVSINLLNCPGATLLNTSQTVFYPRSVRLVNGAATVTLPDNTTQIACSGNQNSYYTFTLISGNIQTLIRAAQLPPGSFALANLANIITPPFSAGVIQGPTGPGFRYRGPWAPFTSYEPMDVVTVNGVGYYSNCEQTSGANFDPTLWNAITTLQGPVTTTTANGASGDFKVVGNLTAATINNTYYIDPTSSIDILTQVTSISALAGDYAVIICPSGVYSSTAQLNLTFPHQTFRSEGKDSCIINHTGANALTWRPPQANYSFTPGGAIQGITIFESATNATIVDFGNLIGAKFEDFNVYGPGGITDNTAPSGTCFHGQNTYNWTERMTLRNVHVGGCATNFDFAAPTGSGTSSFGYWDLNGVWSNQSLGTTGLKVEANAALYHTLTSKYQFNISGSGSGANPVLFDIAGVFGGGVLATVGENYGQAYTDAHIRCGGYMQFTTGGLSTFTPPNIIVDCPTTTAGTLMPPYYVGGIVGEAVGVGDPPVTNLYGSTDTDTYALHPFMISRPAGNGAATMGVMTRTDGLNVVYDTFAYGLKKCDYTLNPFALPNAMKWVRCTDGDGNTHQLGGLFLDGAAIIRGTQTTVQDNVLYASGMTVPIFTAKDGYGGVKFRAYSDGSAAFNAIQCNSIYGTAGQYLTSGGPTSACTWTTPPVLPTGLSTNVNVNCPAGTGTLTYTNGILTAKTGAC